MYPYKTTIVVFWGSTDDDLDRSLSHCYHMLSKNTWWFSSIGFLQIWKIHLIVLKIVWICETLSSKWCWWFWKKSFVRSSIKFSICQELLWCTSKMDPKTNLGLGPIFMPTTKEPFWHQKILCGNWQAKEKHTRNYQLVGWRVSFFSTYQRLGPMSQRKSIFSGTHCFHTQILKPHLNFSNRHPSPIHAAPTT